MSEVRLIDANALKDAHIECPENVSFFGFGEIVERFLQTIDEQPTVDAVPVVRCRECKRRGTHQCKLFRTELNEWTIEFESTDLTQPDWFCADGKRKEQSDG